ncbi:MAG: ABC transporter ATP-binding protein [Spirochaetaceae bacterium]|jgi:putative ABC transport system ATP-binding protein|nr:ABC transporter ATP-binding protein [Spirochaetaceae bacterium]
MIKIENLSRYYQMGPTTVKAIDQLNINIQEGEFVSIVGPSGSGKSTLMNIIGCLDSPTTGKYTLVNEEVARLSRDRLAEIRNKYIGFVFQSFNLLGRESAVENVELPLIYAGVPPKERRARAMEILKRVELDGREFHRPNELSGGQRQRVAIARALATRPKILLADEPTGALDTKTGIQIMRLFKELQDEGVTLIMVTHDNEVAAQGKRIIQVRDGKVLIDTPVERWNP